MPPVHAIVQLPFPSTGHPQPEVRDYYRDYSARFRTVFPEFFVPDRALWELPLWVAHLAGMLESLGVEPSFVDLSRTEADPAPCLKALMEAVAAGDTVYLSPLAQNFDLARQCARDLERRGVRTVLGGNMAAVAARSDASLIFRGQLDRQGLCELLRQRSGVFDARFDPRRRVSWTPSYKLLGGYQGRLPLLRINASHGCLFHCSFCGDAWSRRLLVVEREALAAEVEELERRFPDTRLIYVGDKTFGQSKEAVTNLLAVFERRPQYRFVIQTHFLLVDQVLMETMRQLGVTVVELGLESADPLLLRQSNKSSHGPAHALDVVRRLDEAGFRVVLNVLGGLPHERRESHQLTVDFLHRAARHVWLINLYNFVPYPLTPEFPMLRSRIVDWDFSHWREDGPPVFRPYHLSAEESWELFLSKVATAHRMITGTESAPVPLAAVVGA